MAVVLALNYPMGRWPLAIHRCRDGVENSQEYSPADWRSPLPAGAMAASSRRIGHSADHAGSLDKFKERNEFMLNAYISTDPHALRAERRRPSKVRPDDMMGRSGSGRPFSL